MVRSAAAMLCLALGVAGCGGSEIVRPAVNVSVGQQLIDLKRARDSGALSPREYESQKSQLIRSVE